MKFEEFEQEDILKLFNLITKEVDQLFFMVDQAFRVQYFNQAFSRYFKRNISDIIDKEFGAALGCANMQTDQKKCAFTSYCSTCEIRKAFHKVFSGTSEKLEFELVREFEIADETLVRHLAFKIIHIELSSSSYALCIITDKRIQDDLTMFINPNASI